MTLYVTKATGAVYPVIGAYIVRVHRSSYVVVGALCKLGLFSKRKEPRTNVAGNLKLVVCLSTHTISA